MARRNRNRLVVPEAAQEMAVLQNDVMRRAGFHAGADSPRAAKYEVAKSLGVPMKPGYNGKLTTEEAGKVGGEIGGRMVKELVRRAKAQLSGNRTKETEVNDVE